jgi:hypothetical protein
MVNHWVDALKQYKETHIGSYKIPKKDTQEYDDVMKIYNSLKNNVTVIPDAVEKAIKNKPHKCVVDEQMKKQRKTKQTVDEVSGKPSISLQSSEVSGKPSISLQSSEVSGKPSISLQSSEVSGKPSISLQSSEVTAPVNITNPIEKKPRKKKLEQILDDSGLTSTTLLRRDESIPIQMNTEDAIKEEPIKKIRTKKIK